MAIVFYVGEQPTDPLVVTVRDDEGVPVNLSPYTTVSLVGDELPAGTCSVTSATQGKVQYDFDAPFTTAGVLELQVQMSTGSEDGGVDLSAPFVLTVADPAEVATLLVSPEQVEATTGIAVAESDVARAQGLISLACGRNLSDAVWLASLSTVDLYWLTLAVSYQASETVEAASGLGMMSVPGATSIANGDVRVTFRSDASSSIAGLGNLASTAVSRLSWMRSFRSVQAKPFSTRAPAPDPWVTMNVNHGWPY